MNQIKIPFPARETFFSGRQLIQLKIPFPVKIRVPDCAVAGEMVQTVFESGMSLNYRITVTGEKLC